MVGLDAGAMTGGKPGALRGGGAGHLDTDLGVGDLGEAGAIPGGWPSRPHPIRVTIVAFAQARSLATRSLVNDGGLRSPLPSRQSLGSPGTVPPP
jgi:hypothetical protein